jgi:kinetochore protein Spc7/SPC105
MPPLREIPAHISTRKGSPKKTTPPSAREGKLIDFDIDPPAATITGTHNLPNPFQVGTSPAINEIRVTLRTEEEQQAAAREREEKERKEMEKEIMSRRDARRKSLANRRVSFAPEATLHTWDVVVEYQDSTTSSNSTNSTRRASSASTGTAGTPNSRSPGPLSSDPSEPPSTPPEQIEEDTVKASPEHQRDLHQKKRRRSSGIPPMNFNNPDDEFMSSSPFSGDSAGDADEVMDDEDERYNSNSDSGDDDGTMMSLERGETTDMSMASVKSGDSTGWSTRLEEALRLATRQAGTQGIDFDEHGNQEPEDEEVVASFAPWSKKNPVENLESQQDQENVNPFSKAGSPPQDDDQSEVEELTMDMTHAMGGILPGQQQQPEEQDEDEMSMDVTRAFGTIISNEVQKASGNRRKSMAGRRQSTRRRSSGEESSLGDGTMDLTMAVGGIQPAQDHTVSKEDEDITMEFTSVVGGVLPQANPTTKNRRRSSMGPRQKSQSKRRESLESSAGDETMDMTVAMGGIMPSITEVTGEQDATMGMDMTTALGGILPPQRSTGSRSQAKKVMEMETDLGSSPFQAEVATKSPPNAAALVHTVASETGSPSLGAFRGKGLRRSTDARHSTTPKSRLSTDVTPEKAATPVKKPATPSKQLTPQLSHPTTPGKTPPSKNVVMRTSSPKRLFKDEIKASTTPQSAKGKKSTTPNKLFQQDKTTGVATPSFVLTSQRRRSSGIGLDKEGLGSPRLAVILDRRQSIGEQAKSFVPSQPSDAGRGVHFDDPRVMEEEIDKEREQDGEREDGRKILEREADQAEGKGEKDATLNLKEMIQSLTPKKKSLKGRKSLHVGAAKGILGKRPVELDEDEEDEENDGMKRLKNHQGSPVKNVKLQGPPSKAETTGRMTRAARKSLEQTNAASNPSTSSPQKAKPTTPRNRGRFKDAEADTPKQQIERPIEKEPVDDPAVSEESFGDDRIQLQDFLNMTSIRFMELTTTKRRHTVAPGHSTKGHEDDRPVSLEDCVAAGAATIPMLELFQHVS